VEKSTKKKVTGRFDALKDSKSGSRGRNSVKPHYTRKRSRTSKTDKREFDKFMKSKTHKSKKTWKPIKRKSGSQKSRKNTRWEEDFNWPPDPKKVIAQEPIRKKTVVGLPNWPPKAPSPSGIPPPVFRSNGSPSPINFSSKDIKIIEEELEQSSKLLRPVDLLKMKKSYLSKAEGIQKTKRKKKKKTKRKKKKKKKRKKKQTKKKKKRKKRKKKKK
tara:strand:- start:145 stop:792 length:648 start_codon:yes stop_codon:yes gene_type:complete